MEGESDDESQQDSDRKVRPQKKSKKPANELDFDLYFSKEEALKRLKAKKTDVSQCKTKLKQIPNGFEHEIDYTKYHPKAVYEVFSTVHY